MNRDNLSRAIPVLLIVIIIVIAIAAIVSIGRSIFGGDDSGDTGPSEVERGRSALTSTDITRAVRFTNRGPIVADENFRSYQITITPTSRSMTIYEGYLQNVIETRTYTNNTPAYEAFVHALDRAGMMHGELLKGDANDHRGVCSEKNLFEYEVLQAERTVKKLWTASCSSSKGSMYKDASAKDINDLFKEQIPASDDLIDRLDDHGKK